MHPLYVSGIGTAASATTNSKSPPPRLVKAADEFEAQMMQELLKPLTQDGDEDDNSDGSIESLQSFASEALGTALARNGGFGIAAGIVRELSHIGNDGEAAPVTDLKNQNLEPGALS